MEYDYQLLKNTRLAQGISTDKLAFDLCLSERQIDSIENNLPDFFYSTELKLASVKKCAQALGLDLKIVLRHPEVISTEFINSSVEGHAPIPSQENKMEELASDKVSMMPRQTHSKRIESQNLADHDVIRHATKYIKGHLAGKITLTDLKNATGYSMRSIQLLFQRHFQQTPFEYIEEERLLKAKALIEKYKQSKKIADIAHDVGLTHIGRFSVKFKKRFGVSPSVLAKN